MLYPDLGADHAAFDDLMLRLEGTCGGQGGAVSLIEFSKFCDAVEAGQARGR